MIRPYHTIATVSRDHSVRIFKLVNLDSGSKAVQEAELHGHNSDVYHAEFNLSGTMLATSGQDGCIRIWSRDSTGAWAQVDVVHPKPQGAQQINTLV